MRCSGPGHTQPPLDFAQRAKAGVERSTSLTTPEARAERLKRMVRKGAIAANWQVTSCVSYFAFFTEPFLLLPARYLETKPTT